MLDMIKMQGVENGRREGEMGEISVQVDRE